MQAKIDIEVQDSLQLLLENAKCNHPRLKFSFAKKKRNSIDFNFALWVKKIIWNLLNFSLFIDCA